jgi:MFS family permease
MQYIIIHFILDNYLVLLLDTYSTFLKMLADLPFLAQHACLPLAGQDIGLQRISSGMEGYIMEENTQTIGEIGYKDIFRQREYLKIILASLINRFGDSIDVIAFTWLVYAITGSAAWSAIVAAVNQLPSVLIQPFAGALVEGMKKKRLMVMADITRGIITAGLAALYLMDALNPWILLGFTFINSTVEAFRLPAAMAVTPQVLEKKYYEYGTALNSTLSAAVELIGLGAAGFIIGIFGIGTAIALDGISFFGSAWILSLLRLKEHSLAKGTLQAKTYFKTLAGGFSYLKGQPAIRNFCLLAAFINAAFMPLNSLQMPLIQEVLGQGSELLSIFSIAFTAGMGAGAFVYPLVSSRLPVRTLVVGFGVLIGAGMYAIVLPGEWQLSVPAIYGLTIANSFLIAFSTSILSSALRVQFMKTVRQEYLSRVAAIFNAGASAATPIGAFLVSAFTTACTVSEIIRFAAVFCVIIYLGIALLKVRLE